MRRRIGLRGRAGAELFQGFGRFRVRGSATGASGQRQGAFQSSTQNPRAARASKSKSTTTNISISKTGFHTHKTDRQTLGHSSQPHFPNASRATGSLFIAEALALPSPIRECGVPLSALGIRATPPSPGDQAPAKSRHLLPRPVISIGPSRARRSASGAKWGEEGEKGKGAFSQPAQLSRPAFAVSVLCPPISSTLDALQPEG